MQMMPPSTKHAHKAQDHASTGMNNWYAQKAQNHASTGMNNWWHGAHKMGHAPSEACRMPPTLIGLQSRGQNNNKNIRNNSKIWKCNNQR